jgi:DNA adenine methylase
MRYVAGKGKIAKPLSAAILAHTHRRVIYFEPFVGGGAMLRYMAPHFQKSHASDLHKDLILMWQALQGGWQSPAEVTEQEFYAIRSTKKPSALRGFVGFACAFGGKWDSAYARFTNRKTGVEQNFAAEAGRNNAKIMAALHDCTFTRCDYLDVTYTKNAVIYCDPPYKGTYSHGPAFDHKLFWEWARRTANEGAHVYVSEYSAPDDFVSIWSKERAVMFLNARGSRVTEHLFVHKTQIVNPYTLMPL